ncbi:cadherin-like domain-containing protein [Azospirillum sp. A26]|uniref:cadherin-like domain-containing protein n=1 Tax=Azospirillum sp. A26 TaxID=3160607 RepID=UPI00366DBA61
MSILTGTSGNDTLIGGLTDDELYGLDGDDRLDGAGGADSLFGGAGNDTLTGGAADAVAGATLAGGSGDDLYLIANPLDRIVEAAGEGTDEVRTGLFAYSLADGVEHLTYTGSAAFAGTGNALDNRLTGGAGADSLVGLDGNDTLDGGLGADTLVGGLGNDVYLVDDAGDVVTELTGEGTDEVRTTLTAYTLGANIESLTFTGAGAFSGTGNELDNRLQGGAGNDTLAGGLGLDTLMGGAGNDTYIIDDAADLVVEAAGGGTDEVRTSLSAFTLAANVEVLTYTGSGSFAGTGSAGNDTLRGRAGDDTLMGAAGNDWLDGGAGADSLIGGSGNDTYIVDDAGDQVVELAGEGSDTVRSAVDYTLGGNVEALVLTGGALTGTGNDLDNSLTGTAADNVLTGLEGNDTLNGGAGADTLIGGAGNDTYVVDNIGDVLVELPGEGIDTVQSSISHTLLADFENLTLTGSAALTGTGNAANNLLIGNGAANLLTGLEGDDTLNGGGGPDTLVGGTGNDFYVVDNAGDVVVEQAGEGTDTVNASVSWTLGANIENLTLTGSAAINATGNELNNVLTGNSGANVLDGGLGADSMAGGAGNDIYIVDDAGDVVTELTSQGTDEVRTSLAVYTLGANVELLTYAGSGPFSGSGNDLANRLAGAGGDDSLSGGAGNDTLIGGAGADTLDGGTGTDTASYATAAAGVVVDLASGSGTAGDAADDVLLSIENLTGSGFADTLSGDGGANLLDGGAGNDSLTGGAGNDTLIGGAGADTLDGGSGSDTASYATSATAVAVDLAAGGGSLGDAAGDVLLSIEHLTGGAGNDTLRGDGGANRLDGGAGNDVLEGRGGNDTLVGGSGSDTAVYAGSVRDYVATKVGSDWTIQATASGEGNDTLQGVEWVQFADALLRLDANNAPLLPGNLNSATDEDAAVLSVDLLQGAFDFEGGPLSVTGLSQTGGPVAAVSVSNGVLGLDPAQFGWLAAGQSANLTFAYGVSDGSDATPRTLTVTVAGRNDAPVVSGPVTAVTDEDAAALVVNLLQGASDPDQGDVLLVTGFSQTGGRAVSVTRNGSALTIDPGQFNDLAAGESATLTFGYGVTDGIATTAQSLSVTVQGRNDAPVAADDARGLNSRKPLVMTAASLLANDRDPDGDPLHIVSVQEAVGGHVSLDASNNVVFVPAPDFNGTASFEYTVSDPYGAMTNGMVRVTVDAPPLALGTTASLVAGVQTIVGQATGPIDFVIDQGRLTTLTDGGYVAVWWTAEGNSSDVYARRYGADGAPAGEAFGVNTVTTNSQGSAVVTALPDGGFVVAWHSMDGPWLNATSGIIQQQRYDSSGTKVGTEETVNGNTGTLPRRFPSVTTLADGGWVVAWTAKGQPGDPEWGSYAQRYDAQGQKMGGEVHLNSYTADSQNNPVVTALADGGWVASWVSGNGQDGSLSGVYMQRFDASNQPVGGEVRVTTTTADHQSYATLTGLQDGGWVVVWASRFQDGSGYGAYARVFNANGTARTGEVMLNQLTPGDQYQLSVRGLADGSFMTAWVSADATSYLVEGRRFSAQGQALGGEFTLSDGRIPTALTVNGQGSYPYQAPALTARPDGGFTVSWRQPSGSGTAIVTRSFMASDVPPIVSANSGATGQGTILSGEALVCSSHVQGERWGAGGLQQLTHYQFVDQTGGEGSGYFTVNGVRQETGTDILVSADELGTVQWHGGTGIGSDDFRVRGSDGVRWSDWASGTMTTLPRSSSLITGPSRQIGQATGPIDFVIDQGRLTTLTDGGYVAVWWTAEGNSSDVYARRYRADGAPAGEAFRVNTVTTNSQGSAVVTALPDGGFVVAWHSMDGPWLNATSGIIQQQRYDSSGTKVGTEETVNGNTGTLPRRFPSVTTLADGGWVVAWTAKGQPGDPEWGSYAQRYDAQGQKMGGEVHLNSYTADSQNNPVVTALADGGWVASWVSGNGQDGSLSGVYMQRFDASNQPVGGEVRVTTTTADHQSYATLTGLQDGGWVVVWASRFQDGSGYGAYARVFNANGTARTGEVMLNQLTPGDQYQLSVRGLADGSFMTAWVSADATSYLVEGRRFSAQGQALGGEFTLSDGRIPTALTVNGQGSYPYQAPALTARPDGGFTASWRQPSGNGTAIVTRTFTASPTTLGSYIGTTGSDVLFGSTGSDMLTGGTGADRFLFTGANHGIDTITDFQSGVDRIELVGVGFGNLPVGPLDASHFALNAPADMDDRIVFSTTTGQLSYDPDGNGSLAATPIALLNVHSLSSDDIWVVAQF